MEESEFYFEETNPRKAKIVFAIILLIISILFILLLYYRNVYTLNVKKEVVYEVGDTLSEDIINYLNNKIIDEDDYSISLINVPNEKGILTKVGEYNYRVKYKSISKKGKIIVEDNTPPIVETTNLKVGVNEEYELDEFLTVCEDYSKPCNVKYKKESDSELNKKSGIYAIDIVISDQYNNKVTKTVKLEVKKNFSRENIKKNDLKIDHIEPKYEDFNNKLFISYSEGVNSDELDEDPKYNELLELAGEDLTIYLPDEYRLNQITEAEIIFVYNKYDYVIGYAVKVKLDNDITLYLSK